MPQTVNGYTVPAGSDAVSTIDDTLATFAGQFPAQGGIATLASPTFTGTPSLPNGSLLDGLAIPNHKWVSFTPSWTNATVGNGTNSGFYMVLGKLIIGHIAFTLGTTSTVGTNPRFAPPVSSVSGNMNGTAPVGWCYLQDTGVTVYSGVLNLDTGGFRINSLDASASDLRIDPVNATNPHTWGSTDIIGAWFQYQID